MHSSSKELEKINAQSLWQFNTAKSFFMWDMFHEKDDDYNLRSKNLLIGR